MIRFATLALGLWLSVFVSGDAQAQRVTLEIAPSVMRSEPQLSAYLRRALPAEIQKTLAGRYRGPLRVRILDAKFMRDPGFGIVDRADYLDGVMVVPGKEPKPIRLTLPFDRTLFMFTPQGENVRAQNLASVFAQWVAKYL
jgi:hypothetical protein